MGENQVPRAGDGRDRALAAGRSIYVGDGIAHYALYDAFGKRVVVVRIPLDCGTMDVIQYGASFYTWHAETQQYRRARAHYVTLEEQVNRR